MSVSQRAFPHQALLRLTLAPGIGPRLLRNLLEHFPDAEAVLAASGEKLAEVPRLGSKTIAAIRRAASDEQADFVLRWCQRQHVDIVAEADPQYPPNLTNLADAPAILYTRGDYQPRDSLAIAIVGSRHATHYGLKQAARFARELARAGVTIVSGLARGIDAAAHRGALEVGGRTIAVLGGGLGNIYPAEHADLANEITAQGALFSEYPPLGQPRGSMFPQRNRLISGMSLGVLVIEAAQNVKIMLFRQLPQANRNFVTFL